MAEITAKLVKELREKSGAGMMDCKQALVETSGDVEAAIDWLRKKGIAKAEKKSGRTAAEGLVGVASDGKVGAVVEVNSETDFVARNEKFQEMVSSIAKLALGVDSDVEVLKAVEVPGAGKNVADHLTDMVATIGENMGVRRTEKLAVDNGVVASYVHNQTVPGMGKIGVLVALESTGDEEKLAALGKQIAMHVAATNPLAVSSDDLDQNVVERERQVLADQARDSGKPEEVIAKMIEGRLRKFFEEVVLLSQTFVIDGENTVGKAVELASKDIGAPVTVKGFVRYALGEGIEKEEADFAAEVAAAVGS
ncbi:MAG: translation elongation factor Ts [Hyphomicrobiales bacterium]